MADDGKEPSLSTLTADADILGIWLTATLTGKQERYITKASGEELAEGELKVPGTYGIGRRGNSMPQPFFDCALEICIHWDQWVQVTIECTHGKFDGESRYFNVTEALLRAVSAFNEVDHPERDAVEGETAS